MEMMADDHYELDITRARTFILLAAGEVARALRNGPAVAGGCEIALACDMIIASEKAIFNLPEPQCGLIAGAGGIYRLSRALPPKLAMELVLTGKAISAERAAAFGMVNHVVPIDHVQDKALSLASEINASSPSSVQLSLSVLEKASQDLEPKLQSCSERALSTILSTGDFREGISSFFEKRPPELGDPNILDGNSFPKLNRIATRKETVSCGRFC